MTSGTEISRTVGDLSTVSRRPAPAPRWSRRRGVLSVFAALATAAFVAAYIVPLTAVPVEAQAAEIDPLSLYASAIEDAQLYNAGDTAVIALERSSEYSVYVKPTPTPTPTPTADPIAAGSSAGGSGSSGASAWSPPFVAPDPGSAQAIAFDMVAARGWGESEFACLVALWKKESGWRVNAYNASSGAYGIPQALPGRKMASAGSDWETNPATQIAWGLGYIKGRYGTPCGAWAKSQRSGWY
ncbi:lytic transglycosylase domain-containing protein [Microbacterium sp. 179-B 1A2 NHS]|uniref:aggregation-promoting factor C-terminal-like domain-containing protein n=1 Tax=Microbacterium sp. 179-B 1A2 NHS TaxID=3142383 RepID=UPI0039A2C020